MNYTFTAVVLLFILLQFSKAKYIVIFPNKQVERHARLIYSASHAVSTESTQEWLNKNKTPLIIQKKRYARRVRTQTKILLLRDPSAYINIIYDTKSKKEARIARRELHKYKKLLYKQYQQHLKLMSQCIYLLIEDTCNNDKESNKYHSINTTAGTTVGEILKQSINEFQHHDMDAYLSYGANDRLCNNKKLCFYNILSGSTLLLNGSGLKSGNPTSWGGSDMSLDDVQQYNEEPPSAPTTNNMSKARLRKENLKRKVSETLKKMTASKRRKAKERRNLKVQLVRQQYGESHFMTSQEKKAVFSEFENKTKCIQLNHCKICRCVGLNIQMSRKKSLQESTCKKCEKLSSDYWIKENLLPVWFDKDNIPQYQVPIELSSLSDAEKMLIQRISPFVPLHHIKSGTLGLRGHICCFPQDISSVCNVLPRLPDDVHIIKMLQTYRDKIGDDNNIKAFCVRRANVLCALQWLKKYHSEYKNISILETNLDWMGNKSEATFSATVESTTEAPTMQV